MGQRSVFGAVGVAMAVALAGCGDSKFAEDWEEAVKKVEGVRGVSLKLWTGGTFQLYVSGTIETEGADRAETLRIYGAATRALAWTANAYDRAERVCGGVVGRGRDGHEVYVFDLRPDLELKVKDLAVVSLKNFLN